MRPSCLGTKACQPETQQLNLNPKSQPKAPCKHSFPSALVHLVQLDAEGHILKSLLLLLRALEVSQSGRVLEARWEFSFSIAFVHNMLGWNENVFKNGLAQAYRD